MARTHHLLRLPLAAIWRAPQRPLVARADRVHRIPKIGCDPGVRRIFQHACALAVLDLPPDFATELEVVAFVVDGPRPVRLHVDAMIGVGDQLFECQRFFARENADVGHPDHGQTVPAFGAQRPAGAILADRMRGFAGTEIAGEQTVRMIGVHCAGTPSSSKPNVPRPGPCS